MDAFTALWQKLRGLDAVDPKQVQEYRVASAAAPYSNVPGYPASTFITNVRYRPNSERVFVRMGGKTYVYPLTERQLAAWMKSKSLGQWYNKYLKLK